ncbi:MAG TPA: UDP-N-acetylmuramoyl-L-alanyl-D-glutamate--2,6-diaminopimelate ligase [Solirubrobacteraceae bacterium]|jgi:UDP-N-acetylmuramoyl-L-alanyl-D-glutamate--2,6-diaminopimelate ligase
MRLDQLIATGVPSAEAAVEITDLAYDSRRVQAGSLFFCVPGFFSDGHDFAAQAVARGAEALVVERPLGLGVPEVRVESVRTAMGPIAARFYGEPTSVLRVVGITGTNGKTTTAFLVRALLQASGEQCGLLGTVKSVLGGVERPVTRTTPEAIDLQADFRAMLDGGDRACAIEVSSHALELGRTEGVHFAAALFTNLTQDHLDFHDSMEDYFQAKRRLFFSSPAASGLPGASRPSRPGVSVVNIGDSYGRRLAAELGAEVRTFAVEAPADYSAAALRCDFEGCRFTVRTPAGEREARLPMPGRFNVANALGALALAHALGGELDVLVAALERGVRVPGRFEPVEEGQGFAVLVDYAHTPDSLENVLGSARELLRSGDCAQGRVICVFGAGGDRDRGKRPLMGEIVARLADIAIVTSDNPRSERPEAIIEQIMAGIRSAHDASGLWPGHDAMATRAEHDARRARETLAESTEPSVLMEVERGAAIDRSIALAREGDVVVIAGKGHEQGQELENGRKVPFDDVTVARQALRLRMSATAGPVR